jgi:hypothetical protein
MNNDKVLKAIGHGLGYTVVGILCILVLSVLVKVIQLFLRLIGVM